LVDGKGSDREALELFFHHKEVAGKELGTSQTLLIDKLTRAIKGKEFLRYRGRPLKNTI